MHRLWQTYCTVKIAMPFSKNDHEQKCPCIQLNKVTGHFSGLICTVADNGFFKTHGSGWIRNSLQLQNYIFDKVDVESSLAIVFISMTVTVALLVIDLFM
jgi:hypothetical protein